MGQLVVACLCAQWCNTCTQYRQVFDTLAAQWPSQRFLWVDVEEREDLLGELDIDNFPTLLIGTDQGELCFAGTVTPHAQTLERLCSAASQGELRPGAVDPHWREILSRILAGTL